ncbi:5175_t:CDS:2 [Funneliformis geosporum]|nr:5175_t:CDS:2 [Funneliformis geosporum]
METDKKSILLEKARQIINDLDNISLYTSKLEIKESNMEKFLPYIKVLEKELQLITEKIQQIQCEEEKERKLVSPFETLDLPPEWGKSTKLGNYFKNFTHAFSRKSLYLSPMVKNARKVLVAFLEVAREKLNQGETINFKGYFSIKRSATQSPGSKNCDEHHKELEKFKQANKGKGITAFTKSNVFRSLVAKTRNCAKCKVKKEQLAKNAKLTNRINFKPIGGLAFLLGSVLFVGYWLGKTKISKQTKKIPNHRKESKRKAHYGCLLLCCNSGLRISEAVKFDLKAKTSKGLYKIDKPKGKKERLVYVPREVIKELKAND